MTAPHLPHHGLSPARLAWRRFRRHRPAMGATIYIVLLLLTAIIGPEVWRWEMDQLDDEYLELYAQEHDRRQEQMLVLEDSYLARGVAIERLDALIEQALGPLEYPLPAPPSWRHPLGTDALGRDVLARILHGARISLTVAFAASFIALIVGVIYGAIAGYVGGWPGLLMMRIVDVLYGIPFLLFVILFILVLEGDFASGAPLLLGEWSRMVIILLALGITYWLPMARVVRAEIMALRTREYALAARALGASHMRILAIHLLPNAMGPIVVMLTLSIPEAIFAEAFLAYIGLGISAPAASWGTLASEGARYLRSDPFLLLWPALAISTTMLAFNFLGDGLRDALDPHDPNR